MTVNSDARKKAQKKAAKKRPQTWKPGQSGNPKGGPKRGMSIKESYAWALSVNAEDMAAILSVNGRNDLSEAFRQMPKGIELKTLWAARIVAATMFEPQPGLVNHVVDRVEGKVAQPITQMSDEQLREFITTTIGIDVSGDSGSESARPDSEAAI